VADAMLVTRAPRPALRPFVKSLWASQETVACGGPGAERELVLPTGHAHLVFRLSELPLRLFDGPGDAVGRTIGHAIVGGARGAPYLRDVSQPVRSVGAELWPGAALALLGVPADELAGRHTPLEGLWGPSAGRAHERLLEVDGAAQQQLDRFESLLAERLPRVRGLHPAVAQALERFATNAPVHAVVRESGVSHRRFIALFRRAVGLPPKLYCRVRRFQGALGRAASERELPWVELALTAGYSDQAHFQREFRELAGVTPGRYRSLAPVRAGHVPVAAGAGGQLRSRPRPAAEPDSAGERSPQP
jgi:AraC-like DNA-binding protein